MLNKNKLEKLFARRVLMLSGFKAFLLSSLVGRLYYLQIVKSDQFTTFSDSNRIKLLLIPPLRGKILDRNGLPFAENKNYYRILFDPEVSSDTQKTIRKLTEILNLDESKYNRMLKKIANHTGRNQLLLYEHLTWNELATVEVNSPDLPGISIDVGYIRHFALNNISAHTIGYLGPVSEQEIAKNPLLNHPDFKIGRSGVEKSYESILRGKAGVRKMEVNAFGLQVRELAREESVPGKDVKLSLDKELEDFVGKRLEGLSGSATVIDVATGEVLAMVSSPGFDPNLFTYGVSEEYWQDLLNNTENPLINKSISNQYPPGSTFKIVVALAALKDGIDPSRTEYCPGYINLGRTRFHCWKKGGHGHMNMQQAIMHSCNTYFYYTSKRLGVDKIAQMAKLFGLGAKTDINLSNEKNGLVPTRDWKEKTFNIPWQMGDTLNVGIGQGYMLTTPIQLAIMASRIATGNKVKPVLNPIEIEEDSSLFKGFEKLDIPENHLNLVRNGMIDVVNTPGGTAFGSKIHSKTFSMAGKTGTSQVISKKGLAMTDDNLSKGEKDKMKTHALFVGFGPTENPRYAISVVIEHGGAGSAAAAPVARDIMEEVQKLNA